MTSFLTSIGIHFANESTLTFVCLGAVIAFVVATAVYLSSDMTNGGYTVGH